MLDGNSTTTPTTLVELDTYLIREIEHNAVYAKRAQTSDKDDLCCNLIGLEPRFKHKVDDAAVTIDKKLGNDI